MKILSLFFIGFCMLALISLDLCAAQAAEDPLEDEGNVESEGSEQAEKVPPAAGDAASADSATASEPKTDQAESEAKSVLGPSENAQLSYLFINPAGAGLVGRTLELPAGKAIKLAVHMHNKGDSAFHVDLATAAFRYPMDMSYVIQNFSTVRFHGQDVEPGREASFVYQFQPDAQLAARSFGLTVQLGYRDAEGKSYLHSAINQTVSLYEPDEGFDGETFFMYIFLVVLALLAGAGVWYLLKTYTPAKKLGKGRARPKADAGANNGLAGSADYDIDWIPQSHLEIKKRQAARSPGQRRSPQKQQSGSEGNASD